MNLKSLKVFTLVMEEGSLAGASARLNLSPSAASRLLTLLEEEFDIQLFHRDKKRLIPTSDGEQFYPEAVRILSQIEDIPTMVGRIKTQTALPMRIICHTRVVNGLVLPAMKRLATEQPDLRMRLDIHPRRGLARRTMNGLFDICVSALPLPVEGVEPRVLASTRLHVALKRGHPLATCGKLSFHDLLDEPYIALDQSTVLRRFVDQELARQGLTMTIAHEVSAGAAAYRLVEMGLGFTLADPIALDPELAGRVALVPLAPSVRIEFGCIMENAGRPHAAAAAFEAVMKQVCEERLHLQGGNEG